MFPIALSSERAAVASAIGIPTMDIIVSSSDGVSVDLRPAPAAGDMPLDIVA